MKEWKGPLPILICDKFYQNDLEWHRKLWALSGNAYLEDVLERLVVPLFAFFVMKTSREREAYIESADMHARIVDALADGSADRSTGINEGVSQRLGNRYDDVTVFKTLVSVPGAVATGSRTCVMQVERFLLIRSLPLPVLTQEFEQQYEHQLLKIVYLNMCSIFGGMKKPTSYPGSTGSSIDRTNSARI